MHRRHLLAAAAAFLSSAVAGQGAPVRPTPRPIKRSEWAAAPLWRGRLEARPGLVIVEARAMRRLEDGLILLVREEPVGAGGNPVVQHVRLERRDATGRMVWQQAVPGLPGRFGTFAAHYVAGAGTQRALLVMTYLPVDNRRAALYGRIVEVEESAGKLRALGGIARPRTKEWIGEEVVEFHGALRLGGDRLALYGGFGMGPYQWWIALMQLDGTRLWEAMGHTSAGEVTALRAVPDGFEASVHVIMAWPDASNVGVFRMRFDNAGRLVGSVKMTGNGALLFAPDGSAITLGEGPPPTLIVEDRHGRRRTLAVLPAGAAHLRYRLDDGSLVMFGEGDNELVVSADGRAAVHVERDIRYDTILTDGSIFSATCADDDCRARDLALHRRPW
jgi:hypothetical protein